MRALVFCENRNGARIASALVASRPDIDWQVATTLDGSAVEGWVLDEAARRLPGRAVLDALRGGGSLASLEDGVARLLDELAPDRLVVFNDQSTRGRVVARAAAGVVPVVLVQDGHLDFWFKRSGVGIEDQNARYGASDPDAVCVWGPSMVRFLERQEIDRRGEVHVTGAVGISDDPRFAANVADPPAPGRRPERRCRTILLDQPLSDQRKMDRDRYRSQLAALTERLSAVGELSLKPHPSSSAAHLRWLSTLPDVAVLPHDALLGDDELRRHDLAVTYFSSTYLDTLRAGVPVIFHALEGLDIVMPDMLHPLVRSTSSLDELADVCAAFAADRVLEPNRAGEPIEHFIEIGGDPAARIVEVIERTAPRHLDAEPAAVGPAVVGSTTDGRDPVVAPRSIAVLGDDFSHRTGVAVPIRAFARWATATSSCEVFFVDLRAVSSYAELVELLGDVETVVVNSFAPLWRLPDRAEWIHRLVRFRPVALYAHETEYVFQVEAQARGHRHRRVLDLLPSVRLLCVSEAQASMLAGLGGRDCRVVLNTTPGAPVARRRHPDAPTRVVMAGTAQHRKGIDLFSRTAELARLRGLDWEFRWIGREVPARAHGSIRSAEVTWLGAVPHRQVLQELADADVYLLSSFDDPQPLSVVEAVRQGLRVVTHEGVGTHEVLAGIDGYASFTAFHPDEVLTTVRRVLDVEVDRAAFAEVADRFSIDAFGRRLLGALEHRYSRSDWTRLEDRLGAPAPMPPGVTTAAFAAAVERGDDESAQVIGELILRRRQATDVSIGLAAIHRRAGRRNEAMAMLAVTVMRDRFRARTWLRVAEEAAELGDHAVAVIAATVAQSISSRKGSRSTAAEAARMRRTWLGSGVRSVVERRRRTPGERRA